MRIQRFGLAVVVRLLLWEQAERKQDYLKGGKPLFSNSF